MEAGETPEEALVREIREELSAEISVDECLCTVEYDYPAFHLKMHCYLCSLIGEALHLNEHEAAKWLTKDELDSVKWLPADLEVIETLRNRIMDFNDMEQKRKTPERITSLQPNEIFVFGSNLSGMHGGGAALLAYRKFGAIWGQGVGLQGQSYGIPTMQGGVETIRPYVDEFIEFAKQHPELIFLVTRIGCGIAGFTNEEISPLFEKAHGVENIVLPEGW